MLGTAFVRLLRRNGHDVIALTRMDFDAVATPINEIAAHLEDRLVVNCVALPATATLDQLIAVNGLFPRRLAAMCRRVRSRMVHISTNGVFSGRRGAYREDDVPDPVDPYGTSKLLGEDGSVMVIRTSIVGVEPNSARYLLSWALSRSGGNIRGYTNHRWNGVTTDTLASLVERLDNENQWVAGTYHVHSPDTVSKYLLLERIREAYDVSLEIEPVLASSDEDRTLDSLYPLAGRFVTEDIGAQIGAMARAAACADGRSSP